MRVVVAILGVQVQVGRGGAAVPQLHRPRGIGQV